MTADALPELDPFADDFQQAPFVWYARLREQAPVYRVPGHDWYMVTTMELVREALRDPQTFSNDVDVGRRSAPPAEVADVGSSPTTTVKGWCQRFSRAILTHMGRRPAIQDLQCPCREKNVDRGPAPAMTA